MLVYEQNGNWVQMAWKSGNDCMAFMGIQSIET